MHWLATFSVALSFYLVSCSYSQNAVFQDQPQFQSTTQAPTEAPITETTPQGWNSRGKRSYPGSQVAQNPPVPTTQAPLETTQTPAQEYQGFRGKRSYPSAVAQDQPKPTTQAPLETTQAPAQEYQGFRGKRSYPSAVAQDQPRLTTQAPTETPTTSTYEKLDRSKRSYPQAPAESKPETFEDQSNFLSTFAPTTQKPEIEATTLFIENSRNKRSNYIMVPVDPNAIQQPVPIESQSATEGLSLSTVTQATQTTFVQPSDQIMDAPQGDQTVVETSDPYAAAGRGKRHHKNHKDDNYDYKPSYGRKYSEERDYRHRPSKYEHDNEYEHEHNQYGYKHKERKPKKNEGKKKTYPKKKYQEDYEKKDYEYKPSYESHDKYDRPRYNRPRYEKPKYRYEDKYEHKHRYEHEEHEDRHEPSHFESEHEEEGDNQNVQNDMPMEMEEFATSTTETIAFGSTNTPTTPQPPIKVVNIEELKPLLLPPPAPIPEEKPQPPAPVHIPHVIVIQPAHTHHGPPGFHPHPHFIRPEQPKPEIPTPEEHSKPEETLDAITKEPETVPEAHHLFDVKPDDSNKHQGVNWTDMALHQGTPQENINENKLIIGGAKTADEQVIHTSQTNSGVGQSVGTPNAHEVPNSVVQGVVGWPQPGQQVQPVQPIQPLQPIQPAQPVLTDQNIVLQPPVAPSKSEQPSEPIAPVLRPLPTQPIPQPTPAPTQDEQLILSPAKPVAPVVVHPQIIQPQVINPSVQQPDANSPVQVIQAPWGGQHSWGNANFVLIPSPHHNSK